MTTYAPPSPPFIAARHKGGPQTPKAIVLHATVSPDNPGTARATANWWHGATSPDTSAHYVVDPAEVIQCVGDHTIAFHCGYNTGSIGVEMCDEQTGPASRWQDADSKAIVARTATLVAQLCLAYGIEVVNPTTAELSRKGPHGIYTHNASRIAFGHTTHTDPRDFDVPGFIRMVKAEVARLKAGPAKPKQHLVSDATVVVGNVKSVPLMTAAQVRADYETALKGGVSVGAQAFLVNEYVKSYAGPLNAAAKAHGFAVKTEASSGLAVAYRQNKWTLSGAAYQLLAGGIKAVSPNRGVLRVANTTPGGTRVAFDAFGLPRGWKNIHYAQYGKTHPMAEHALTGLGSILKAQTGPLKSAVILGGDMNVTGPITFEARGGPKAASHVVQSGSALDKMIHAYLFLPDGWSAVLANSGTLPGHVNTDHRFLWAHWRITRPL